MEGGGDDPKEMPFKGPSLSGDDDPELDALLNDALQDFGKPPPAMKYKAPPGTKVGGDAATAAMSQVWTEEFIKQATAQFEKKMREALSNQDKGTPGSQGKEKTVENLSQVVETATKAAVGNSTDPSGLASQINESLKQFATTSAKKPPPTSSSKSSSAYPDANNPFGANPDFFDEDFSKLMGNLGNFDLGEGGSGDPELDEILPFMTNVMQKLLSKDLLYPVLTDIVDRYPDWLADNRPKISPDDYDRYNKQYDFMKKICEEYAAEKQEDTAESKRQRFDRISDLMMKVQCTGPPPTDLVGEEGLPGVDPSCALGMGDQCNLM